MRNARLAIVSYEEGHMVEREIFANREISEKAFKKWYNHVFREEVRRSDKHCFNGLADIFAVYDDESGDWHELANYWGIQEMKHNPHCPM